MKEQRNVMIAALSVMQIILLLIEKEKRCRSIGVRALFRRRQELGAGNRLLNELRFEANMCFSYTRLNYARFEYLLSIVTPLISSKRKMKTVISPAQRLAMTLRFLAVGADLSSLSLLYRCGKSTVSLIVRQTVKAFVRALAQKVIAIPQGPDDWKKISLLFWEKWNLGHCLGAIDGRHMQVIAPAASGSTYFNYKKTFSTVLLAVCDAEYAFISVDVGAEGSLSNGAVLKDSKFGQQLQSKALNLPAAENLPNSDKVFDYFFVGDGAFQLRTDLLKPFACRKLSLEEAIYNYRISRGRRVVKNAFGILVARWRIFRSPLSCWLETADYIILATVCLHNFKIKTRNRRDKFEYLPQNFVDKEKSDGSEMPGAWRDNHIKTLPPTVSHNSRRSALQARSQLCNFFNNEGAVSWQEKRVRAGFWGAHISN